VKKIFTTIITIVLITILLTNCGRNKNDKLIFVCSEDNNLYNSLVNSDEYQRFSSIEKSVETAVFGSAVLILADNYPHTRVKLPAHIFDKITKKNLKVYIEYPDSLPDIKIGETKKTKWERGVVTSDIFGESLKKMRIVMIHDCHYVQAEAADPYLVIAKVAGFDTAIYGLDNTETHPLLFEHPQLNILISTTKLSNFITGRYAPKDAWSSIWKHIFEWLQPNEPAPELHWTESVHPTYPKDKMISQNDRMQAASRGVEWFYKSNLLATSLEIENGKVLKITPDGEYGKEGIRECYLSKIIYDGTQSISESRRADCTSESAMALAIHGIIKDNQRDKATAENLQDYVYFNSRMQKGPRSNPESPSFGFIDWYQRADDNKGVYYADDNARVIMGTLTTAAALKIDRWDDGVLACLLANYRATSSTGFKPRRLDEAPLQELGWRHYRDAKDYYHFAPHYQSWIMAMYLWLYDKTHYKPMLEIAKAGIENMMNAYPEEWHWTNGLQQERARMVLPLAWLLRVEDTPRHRDWFNQMINDLLSFQDKSGAIREDLGNVGHGRYGPPKSNADYGTNEAPLIQVNGDPIADMLYTSNFAFLSLTEAAAVSGDEKIKNAVNKLADFMVKIQVRSDSHPELDGVWFRAFEYNRWEYWGSNADLGWGVWSTETGWTQGWITTMLMMQELDTNLWDFTMESKIADKFEKYKNIMLEKQ